MINIGGGFGSRGPHPIRASLDHVPIFPSHGLWIPDRRLISATTLLRTTTAPNCEPRVGTFLSRISLRDHLSRQISIRRYMPFRRVRFRARNEASSKATSRVMRNDSWRFNSFDKLWIRVVDTLWYYHIGLISERRHNMSARVVIECRHD